MTRWFRRPSVQAAAVALLYGVLGALYLGPLFTALSTRIASDPYDPVLNATILWWNATVIPFTTAWWNQPQFHPALGVTAFTETLVGLAPLSSPIYWLTGDVIATYNLVFFLSWPLCACGGALLVHRLTKRVDAAVLGGLAFGFSPYRLAEVGHLQSLCAFGLPLALAGVHGYVDERRRRWLVLFGTAWLVQSLANGYYLLFGSVLIALWTLWLCSSRRGWSAIGPVVATAVVSSLPLVAVLWRYKQIHDVYGLRRMYIEALTFSAHPESWFQVSGVVRVWSGLVPSGSDDLFPGLTAVALTLAAVVVAALTRQGEPDPSRQRQVTKGVLVVVVLLSVAALGVMLRRGPWELGVDGRTWFRMRDPYRALGLLALASASLLALSRRLRRAVNERHPQLFLVGATLLMALLACGPVLSVRDTVILDPAPYRWLMRLPGFDQVRVPSRFWMLGVLTLSASAGVAFASIAARLRPSFVRALFVVCAAGLLADGWITAVPTADAPPTWASLQAGTAPILELPLGPEWDGAATYRTTAHHRRVVNGVSGYDPPFYAPLQVGLREQQPESLAALASLGEFDVVIDPEHDAAGSWTRYALGARGAVRTANADGLVVVHVPAGSFDEGRVGKALPVARATSSRGDPAATIDGRLDTDWVDAPQHPEQWLQLELSAMQDVGGVSLAIEEHAGDFPRHVRVEVSDEGEVWRSVWDGDTAARVFLAAQREPRTGWLRLAFPATHARMVRIRQTATSAVGWRVPEAEINAPAR